jgi:hypothetical protein
LSQIYKSDNGLYDWSLSTEDVEKWFVDGPPESPAMSAGDAIFFDHLSLHRTQFLATFTQPRYAIETWFFGDKNFPKNQIPMRW